MAAALCVLSLEAHSGKTALCVALGMEFQERGLSVGYMKPLGKVRMVDDEPIYDWDCVLVPRMLQLSDPLDLVCPALIMHGLAEDVAREPVAGAEEQMRSRYNLLSASRDVVIVEGGATLADGFARGIAAQHLVANSGAHVLLVARYREDLSIDQILMARSILGDRPMGIIINSAPLDIKPYLAERLPGYLADYGVTCYGVLPVDKLLTSVSIRHLVSLLDGEVLCCKDRLDQLVEDFAVGAMHLDAALKYFLRIPNKIVITGGDRADIQLAAIQTSTKALILTGNLRPDDIILKRAKEKGIVYGTAAWKPGDIVGSRAMDEAYEMGKTL